MASSFGPLMEVARIQSEINRLFDNLLDLGPREGSVAAWIPNADILETPDSLVVTIELPGVEARHVALSVHSGNVIVEGEKPRDDLAGPAEFQVAERAFGSFRRVIQLGVPVNTRQAVAVLNNGLLRICFPRVPNRRGEAVPIAIETEE